MLSASGALHRSYLYAPGSDPVVMRKALVAGADAVVLDLEDAVPPERKGPARDAVGQLLRDVAGGSAPLGPEPSGCPGASRTAVHVRVNRHHDGYDLQDVAAVAHAGLDAIRLPKAEQAAAVRAVDTALEELERDQGLAIGTIVLTPIIESARGVLAAAELLRSCDRVDRLAIGLADMVADLGVEDADGASMLHVRSQLVLVSRACGSNPPTDGAFTDLQDADGLEASARLARSLGFFGKTALHPQQLATIHGVFTAGRDEIVWAERVTAALAEARAQGRGVAVVDGSFVDEAIVARARTILRGRDDRD